MLCFFSSNLKCVTVFFHHQREKIGGETKKVIGAPYTYWERDSNAQETDGESGEVG